MRGRFIVVEGLDGSGKSCIAEALTNKLICDHKRAVIRTSEPQNGPIGSLIRLEQKDEADAEVLFYLYAADRKYHCDIIECWLNQGIDVVCDRYWYSTYAYQGLNEQKRQYTKDFYKSKKWLVKPDYTFYIDTPVDECLKRIGNRGGSIDCFENQEVLYLANENYKEIGLEEDFIYIDGTKTIDEEVEEILKELVK